MSLNSPPRLDMTNRLHFPSSPRQLTAVSGRTAEGHAHGCPVDKHLRKTVVGRVIWSAFIIPGGAGRGGEQVLHFEALAASPDGRKWV